MAMSKSYSNTNTELWRSPVPRIFLTWSATPIRTRRARARARTDRSTGA
jgi:hypothetical protein